MTRRGDPEDYRLLVLFFRSLRHWTQEELGRAAGIDPRLISRYELALVVPSEGSVRKLARAAGVRPGWIEPLLNLFRAVRLDSREPDRSPAEAEDPESAEDLLAGLAAPVAAAVRLALTPAALELEALAREEESPSSPEEARARAEGPWRRLESASSRERAALLDAAREYRTWAVCERACHASEKAAADDAGKALELAELALEIARRCPKGKPGPARVEGYAWVFLGNARRVAGRLHPADEAFATARLLWQAGAASDPGVLDEGRVLDLEASLRREQRRFSEALDLHARALAVTRPVKQGSILLNKSKVLFEIQDLEGAVLTLQQASLLVEMERDPRLAFGVRFNLAGLLCHLGRHAEADRLLPEVRDLAARLGNGLDSVRLLWLEAWVAAGLGRREEAASALEEVRREFAAREIDYDMALVSLELAVLYLERGDTGRVKDLAREMEPIFLREGVHREALAALRVFCAAAAKERATADLALRLRDYLERARHDPGLRFE